VAELAARSRTLRPSMRVRRPARDEQEAQRPHAAEHVGVGPHARARLGLREGVELETAGDVMGEDA